MAGNLTLDAGNPPNLGRGVSVRAGEAGEM